MSRVGATGSNPERRTSKIERIRLLLGRGSGGGGDGSRGRCAGDRRGRSHRERRVGSGGNREGRYLRSHERTTQSVPVRSPDPSPASFPTGLPHCASDVILPCPARIDPRLSPWEATAVSGPPASYIRIVKPQGWGGDGDCLLITSLQPCESSPLISHVVQAINDYHNATIKSIVQFSNRKE
jgi:hypothetical protein